MSWTWMVRIYDAAGQVVAERAGTGTSKDDADAQACAVFDAEWNPDAGTATAERHVHAPLPDDEA